MPVVEPEILIDGAHSMERFGAVTERVVGACVAALWRHGVALEGCLLKPQMVIPGAEAEGPRPAPEEVAKHTVAALRRWGRGSEGGARGRGCGMCSALRF